MAAARPASPPALSRLLCLVSCLLAVTCVISAASQRVGPTSREAAPLRALRSEEGSIDDIISKIEKLRQQRKQQQHSASKHPPQPAAESPGGHSRRKFAYYPNDPEYRAPRPPDRPGPAAVPAVPRGPTASRAGHHSDGHGDAAGSGESSLSGSGSETSAPLQPQTSVSPPSAGGGAGAGVGAAALPRAAALRPRGDPETVLHTGLPEPARHKKAQMDRQVLKVRPDAMLAPAPSRDNTSDIYFIVTVAGICAMAVGVTVAGGYCYHRLQKRAKAAGDAEYPAYGVTGPSRDLSPSGDRKLAQSAQMYHYQHQKQQMMAMEKTHNGRHGSASDVDSEEENEEGDYTVYECPGLAPTGEMEVKNPLFHDDPTPAPGPSASEPTAK